MCSVCFFTNLWNRCFVKVSVFMMTNKNALWKNTHITCADRNLNQHTNETCHSLLLHLNWVIESKQIVYWGMFAILCTNMLARWRLASLIAYQYCISVLPVDKGEGMGGKNRSGCDNMLFIFARWWVFLYIKCVVKQKWLVWKLTLTIMLMRTRIQPHKPGWFRWLGLSLHPDTRNRSWPWTS